MSRQSSSNLNAGLTTKGFQKRSHNSHSLDKKEVKVSRRAIRIWKTNLGTIYTAELDHGSLASVQTLLWTQRFLGAVLTSSCTAVLWCEDVVHGFHIHAIWQRLLLTARFKEFIDCRDIAYFHYVLLKVKEGSFFLLEPKWSGVELCLQGLADCQQKTFVHDSIKPFHTQESIQL